MLDPTTYMLLHKYQHRELMKQAEEARLHQAINQPVMPLQSQSELSRMISTWWNQRRQRAQENRLVDGEVIMP